MSDPAASSETADFRGLITNCLIGRVGLKQAKDEEGVFELPLRLGGFDISLVQGPEASGKTFRELKGERFHTTDAIVSNVTRKDIPEVEGILEDACWLLSFAGLSDVKCFGYRYPDGTRAGRTTPVSGVANYFRPSIKIRDGNAVAGFLNQTFVTFRRLKERRKLNIVIAYLVEAERPDQPLEIRLLLAFVVLECLKDTYARSQSIPYHRPAYRKRPAAGGSANPKKWKKYSFEELLTEMFRQVRMRKGIKRIIELRNEIIHSGVSRLPHRSQLVRYEVAHDLIREYLLRLLNFSGTYPKYRGREFGSI